jgi:hypothetical protein
MLLPDPHEAVRGWEGKRLDQHVVHDREHRSRHRRADGQCHERCGSEASIPSHSPARVPNVLKKVIEQRDASLVTEGIHRLRYAGSAHRKWSCCLRSAVPAAGTFTRQVEVRSEFCFKIVIAAAATKCAENADEPFANHRHASSLINYCRAEEGG